MKSEVTPENQAHQVALTVVNSAGTTLPSLPTVPKHLVGKDLGIDYSISLARQQPSIGRLLIQPGFDADSFLDSLGKVLYQAVGDLGIKTLPDEAGEKRITHYLINYYRDFTIQDIRMAFELAIVGELNIDVEHYNSFDLKYICKILNVYRARRNKALMAIEKENKQAEKKSELTEEEKQEIRREFILAVCSQYEKFCETGSLGVISRSLVYSLLEEKGLLKLSKKKYDALKVQAIERYKQKLAQPVNKQERNSFADIQKNLETAMQGKEQNTIEELIKELAIIEFFNGCKKNKTDLKAILV